MTVVLGFFLLFYRVILWSTQRRSTYSSPRQQQIYYFFFRAFWQPVPFTLTLPALYNQSTSDLTSRETCFQAVRMLSGAAGIAFCLKPSFCIPVSPLGHPLRRSLRKQPLRVYHKLPSRSLGMSATTGSDGKHLAAMDDVVKGRFIRKESIFRNWISSKPGARFAPEPNRYRLYVSLACPWAHRCLITRALKGLEDVIPVTVVHHNMGPNGWRFVTKDELDVPVMCEPEPLYGFTSIRDLYFKANPEYSERFTVPVLWDTKEEFIVNNESSEIIVMLNEVFNKYAKNPDLDLYPMEMRSATDEVAHSFYNSLNNGVYRCGFAKSQGAYEEAFVELFDTLEVLEKRLASSRYLMGSAMTLADIRLFVTLIRFDAVYVLHFKTNKKRIMDFPGLSGFTRELYQNPTIRNTVSFEHIKKHYFCSHPTINPLGIVPMGPDLSYLDEPHGRESM